MNRRRVEEGVGRNVELTHLLHIEQGEGASVLLLWVHSFFNGVAIVSLYTAGNALFLARFSSHWLPHAYIVSAAMGIAAGWLYGHARARMAMARLFAALLLSLLGGVLVLRLGLALSDAAWPAFVLFGYQAMATALLSVEFWGVAGQLFTVRQGKRLFGLAGTGELVAMVLGGLATPLLVGTVGTANLLLIGAGGLLGCWLLLRALVRRHGERLTRRLAEGERRADGLRAQARDPYVRWVFLLAVVGVAATRLVDYTFLDQARQRYQDTDELARLFGVFFGLAQAATLILLAFVTGPLLARHGIATGMLFRRVSLTVLLTLAVIVAFAAPATQGLFWLALAARLADLVFLGAFTVPAFLVLYQPLRANRRLSTQMTVESVVGPLASAAAAGSILLLQATSLGGARSVALLTLGVLVAWRFVARRTSSGYRQALPLALDHRRLEGVALPLHEGGLLDTLRRRLASPHPHEALYALDLLMDRLGEGAAELLGPLLDHPHPQVRREAIRRIADGELAEFVDALHARLDIEEDPPTLAAVLRALAHLEEADAVDILGLFIEAEEAVIAEAALVGMLRSGGLDGILVAGERLLQLERSQDPVDRTRAARVLGDVGIGSFYRHLLDPLEDPDPDVRHAALAAAGRLRNPKLWPAVIGNLAHVSFHAGAAQALVEAGEDAIPNLARALSDPQAPIPLRVRIAETCGRIGGEDAVALLRVRMDADDRRLRSAILDALSRAGYRAAAQDRGNIDDILWQELRDAAWVWAARLDIGAASDETRPLLRALDRRLEQIRRRCLRLLSFTADPEVLNRAGEQLHSDRADQRAYALEVLDTVLSGDARPHLMTLFEAPKPREALRRLRPDFPQQLLGRTRRLALVIIPGGHRLEPWVRACAVRAAALLEEADVAAEVAGALDDETALVRETATWALHAMAPHLWAEHEGRVTADGLVPPDLLYWIESWRPGDRAMFLTVEKVMVLRSVRAFADVPEDVLADLAGYLEEIEVAAEEAVYERGAVGRTMYIIAEGRVRVHDGERTFVELGAGEFFGELTTLDPEPHSASVTAVEATRLLGLDRDALYELMSAHPAVLRGLIHTLCQRLRAKGRRE